MAPTLQPLRSGPVPRFPTRVGRYEILLPIASGGMATVYLARAHESPSGFGPKVALKLTHAHLRQEKNFACHLVEEAKLAAQVRHPNVVPVLEVGDDPLGIFLVMEYVEGDTLGNLQYQARKAGTELSVPAGIRVLLDSLAGLHAAHELSGPDGSALGLVHRDFTPQNILVGLHGTAHLTDFGIAKAVTTLSHTATGTIKGKIAYMSPEQARNQALDRRADVFSAGVVAWELLAGRRLYENDAYVSVLVKVVNEEPPALSKIVPGIPLEVERVVASALVHDLDRRCPSAELFASSLKHASAAAGLLARREDVRDEVRRILGPKLEKRRSRVRACVAARRPKSTPTAKTGLRNPMTPGRTSPPPTPSLPAATPLPSLWTLPLQRPSKTKRESSVRHASRPDVPLPVVSRENTATDHVSIQSHVPPRVAPVRIGAAMFVGAILAVVVTVPMALVDFSGSEASPANHTAVPAPTIEPTGSAELRLSPPSTPPVAVVPHPEASASAATKRTVRVTASSKVKLLIIGNRKVPTSNPSTSFDLEMEPNENEELLLVHATSIDGRSATARLEPHQTRLMIRFEQPVGGYNPAK